MPLIRNYYAAFSFNATNDLNLSKNNVYTLRIKGMIHHRIGPLVHNADSEPKCAQIYFNGDDDVKYHMNYSSNLNPFVIIQIQSTLIYDACNPFVINFKNASKKFKNDPSVNVKIVIITNSQTDRRIYNKPTTDEIAVFWGNFGDTTESTKREAIIFVKNCNLKIIDTNKSCYDPIHTP